MEWIVFTHCKNDKMEIKCIYCLQDKPERAYSKREHVMPQCFGTFTPDNLILNEAVCDDCNQYFGEQIEIFLGRDTIEGVMRYRYGIKPRKHPKKHHRIKTKISEGPLKGMIVMPKFSEQSGEIDMEPVLQVGFFNKNTNQYDYFEPSELLAKAQLLEQGYDLKDRKIDFIYKDDEEKSYLLKTLKEKGMDIKLEDERNDWPEITKEKSQVLAESKVRIDSIIYRGLSKIVFNYLTYVEGKEFVLLDDFNGIRDFIRYDKGNSNDYFGVNEPPILFHDQMLRKINLKVTSGHLITIEWRGQGLIGKLSIFNMTTYLVRLCSNFRGIWRPIVYGHHFDIRTKDVSKLKSVSRKLLPSSTFRLLF